jgi:hypothetical protein
VSCVQSFLNARGAALPARSKVKLNQVIQPDQGEESQQSEFSVMGLDFTDADLLAIDGEQAQVSNEALLDDKVAPVNILLCLVMIGARLGLTCFYKRTKTDNREFYISRYLCFVIQYLFGTTSIIQLPDQGGKTAVYIGVNSMLGRMCQHPRGGSSSASKYLNPERFYHHISDRSYIPLRIGIHISPMAKSHGKDLEMMSERDRSE